MIKGSRVLFSALLQRCLARSVMAICSLKARDRSLPVFVALIPQDEVMEEFEDGKKGIQISPPGFSIFHLPFSDDMRNVPDQARFVVPEDDQVDVAAQVIKKLKLKGYCIEAFENPSLQSHYRLIEALALERTHVEGEDDSTIPPIERQTKKLGELSQLFADACGYEELKPKAQQKRKNECPGNLTDAKKVSKPQLTQAQMDGLVKSHSVHKLTVDQLKSFLESMGENTFKLKNKADHVKAIYDFYNAAI